MASFLTALANIGSQYGEASEGARQERLAQRSQELQQQAQMRGQQIQEEQLRMAQQNQQFAQQRQQMELQEHRFIDLFPKMAPQRDASGHLRKQVWDILKPGGAGWVTVQLPGTQSLPGAAGSAFDALTAGLSPDDVKRVKAVYDNTFTETGDEQKAIDHIVPIVDKLQQAKQSREDREAAATRTQAEINARAKESERFRESILAQNQQFQRGMVPYRLEEKAKQMNGKERDAYRNMNLAEPRVMALKRYIEENNLQNQGGILGKYGALNMHGQFMLYQKGMMPDPVLANLFKNSSFLGMIGAAQWTAMLNRSKYTYADIRQHLPAATDTPALLYDKVSWFANDLLPDVQNSLAGLVPPGQTAPYEPGQTAPSPSTPGPAGPGTQFTLTGDPAVDQYLQKQGFAAKPAPKPQ